MTEVPKIVASRLARQAEAVASDLHPDENLLAAFAEQSLNSPARLQILEHLTQCFECREVIALAAPLPATATVLPPPARARWSSWPILRWGAAVACVVVVGAAVSLRQHEAHKGATLAEMYAHSVMIEPVAPQALARQDSLAPAPATAKLKADTKPESPASAPPEKKALAASRTTVEVTGAAPLNDRADVAVAGELDSQVPGRAKDAVNEPQAFPTDQVTGGAMAKQATASAAAPAAPNMVPRWALTAEGSLQRSLDSGRTWTVMPVSGRAHFRALAANGLDIWVGGDAGALYHSSDAGQHWMQIQPAENGEALTADVIGVEFPDLQNGHLNTSTGEVWLTEDAGLTWKKQ